MVSIVTIQEPDLKQVELVISRHVSWGDVLKLGVISHGGACVILMRDGGVGRIGTQALMGSWDASDTCWIEIVDSPLLTEVEGTLQLDLLLFLLLIDCLSFSSLRNSEASQKRK